MLVLAMNLLKQLFRQRIQILKLIFCMTIDNIREGISDSISNMRRVEIEHHLCMYTCIIRMLTIKRLNGFGLCLEEPLEECRIFPICRSNCVDSKLLRWPLHAWLMVTLRRFKRYVKVNEVRRLCGCCYTGLIGLRCCWMIVCRAKVEGKNDFNCENMKSLRGLWSVVMGLDTYAKY